MLSLFSLNTFKWISLGNVEPNPTNSHSFSLNPQHDQPSYMHFPINLSMANLKVPFPPLPITVLTDLASLSTRKSNSKPKQTSTRYKEGGLRAFAGFLLVAGGWDLCRRAQSRTSPSLCQEGQYWWPCELWSGVLSVSLQMGRWNPRETKNGSQTCSASQRDRFITNNLASKITGSRIPAYGTEGGAKDCAVCSGQQWSLG